MGRFSSVPQSLLSYSDDRGRYLVPRDPHSSDPVGTGGLSEEDFLTSVIPQSVSEFGHD